MGRYCENCESRCSMTHRCRNKDSGYYDEERRDHNLCTHHEFRKDIVITKLVDTGSMWYAYCGKNKISASPKKNECMELAREKGFIIPGEVARTKGLHITMLIDDRYGWYAYAGDIRIASARTKRECINLAVGRGYTVPLSVRFSIAGKAKRRKPVEVSCQ